MSERSAGEWLMASHLPSGERPWSLLQRVAKPVSRTLGVLLSSGSTWRRPSLLKRSHFPSRDQFGASKWARAEWTISRSPVATVRTSSRLSTKGPSCGTATVTAAPSASTAPTVLRSVWVRVIAPLVRLLLVRTGGAGQAAAGGDSGDRNGRAFRGESAAGDDRPMRPLLIWDGDCGFCRRSVQHLGELTGDRIAFEPYQTAHTRHPTIPVEAFRAAVHLVEADGHVSRGAEAVFRALALGGRRLPLAAYRWLPGFRALSEWAYHQVAAHRALAARLTQLLVGDLVGPPRFCLTRWVFLRLLALVYLAAFVSLGAQIHGLVGERGLLPAGEFLQVLREARGREALWLAPTLGWLDSGDGALSLLCWGGAAASLLATIGFAQGPLLAVSWAFYLSLVHLGQDFLSFQLYPLLTQTRLLTLLFAPWGQLWPRLPGRERPPSVIVVWLLRLLLFKLMFSSGLTKLTWGDPTWRDLTALTYHYWTQPIPTPLAWYANLLPRGAQIASCAVMYLVEVVLPFLIFAPRRPRRIALFGFLALQSLIAATGNYGFFNLLSVVLCVSLLDDLPFPTALRTRLLASGAPGAASRGRSFILAPVAAVLALLSVPPLVDVFHTGYWRRHPDHPLLRLASLSSPFCITNSYP